MAMHGATLPPVRRPRLRHGPGAIAHAPMITAVVGLAFEARIAEGAGVHVITSGDGRTLVASLSRAVASDCAGLISFGVAGGLSPELPPGSCIVGSAILDGTTRLMTDHDWSQNLLRGIPGAVSGMIVGVPAPIAHPDAKRALYRDTGAFAVDMESHIVATTAAAHGLRMAAVRVITDPAERALPLAALATMRPNGTSDIAAMIRSLMRRPRELPALLQTVLDACAARTTLLRSRRVLASALNTPEVG